MKNTKAYVLEIILLVVLACTLILIPNSSRRIVFALFLAGYAIVTKLLLNKKRQLSIHKKKVFRLVALLGLIYVALLYTAGIYTGYYQATIKFSINTILNYIIPITMIIIFSEYIRTKFINYESKLSQTLNYIIQVLIDLLIFANILKFNSIDNILLILGYILFASMANNLLYNYIAKRYGVKPNIIYRLLTTLYIYIIPITPDIYIFFLSFYKMSFPLLVYYIVDSFYGEVSDSIDIKGNKPIQIITSFILVIIVIYIGLISCLFKYGALVIGSGSMTGTIDKGDVIIISKDIKASNVNKNDIIVFNKNNVKVVHRVVDKKKQGDEYRFYTKGDRNKKVDDGYITEKDLYANVLLKIKNIGLPTIWLHEMIER